MLVGSGLVFVGENTLYLFNVTFRYCAKLSEEGTRGAYPPIGKEIQKWKQKGKLLRSGEP